MTLPSRDIFALERRLDYLIAKMDDTTELYMQAHNGRYLAMLTAGYLEKSVQSAILEFTKKRSSLEVTRFVEKQIAWESSVNRSKLRGIRERFGDGIFERIDGIVDEETRNAVDSIKSLRDQLAHGDDNGTGYGTVKRYHAGVRQYVRAVFAELNG
jgi:RiboL-PSP-HEPN